MICGCCGRFESGDGSVAVAHVRVLGDAVGVGVGIGGGPTIVSMLVGAGAHGSWSRWRRRGLVFVVIVVVDIVVGAEFVAWVPSGDARVVVTVIEGLGTSGEGMESGCCGAGMGSLCICVCSGEL